MKITMFGKKNTLDEIKNKSDTIDKMFSELEDTVIELSEMKQKKTEKELIIHELRHNFKWPNT